MSLYVGPHSKKNVHIPKKQQSVTHQQVDLRGRAGISLHEEGLAFALSGTEHQAYVPGHSHGDVRISPGDHSVAVKALQRGHHCGRERSAENLSINYKEEQTRNFILNQVTNGLV